MEQRASLELGRLSSTVLYVNLCCKAHKIECSPRETLPDIEERLQFGNDSYIKERSGFEEHREALLSSFGSY